VAEESGSRDNRLACCASDGVFRPGHAQPLITTGDWTHSLFACIDRLLSVLKELSMHVSRLVFGLCRTSCLQRRMGLDADHSRKWRKLVRIWKTSSSVTTSNVIIVVVTPLPPLHGGKPPSSPRMRTAPLPSAHLSVSPSGSKIRSFDSSICLSTNDSIANFGVRNTGGR
jgi:hypothetical protein